MAYKTLLFGTDELFKDLKPFYDREVKRGTLKIIATAVFEKDGIHYVTKKVKRGGVFNLSDIDLIIISSKKNFYDRMKFLEAKGVPRERIIDGRVFQVPDLDFPRLINENIVYGRFDKNFLTDSRYSNYTIYPRIYLSEDNRTEVVLGFKSYIESAYFETDNRGSLIVGNFSCISWGETFEFADGGHNPAYGHHQKYVGIYAFSHLDWNIPKDSFPSIPPQPLQILIGSDVWVGRGCNFKCTNPDKPLVIGDGAIIASDSVVVKNIPPYAIVGGNPAQIIKYRFPPHVIEALLRIKWWDWDIDKIHDNFKYFNDVEKFISLHDRED